jgi:hypothetical protein
MSEHGSALAGVLMVSMFIGCAYAVNIGDAAQPRRRSNRGRVQAPTLGGPKAYATVSCGSHELVYEKQHTKLLEASAEWLRFGTYEGRPGSSPK